MKLTCPGCSGTYSAEAWANDAHIRQFIKILSEMPTSISFRLLQYMSMFRASGRGLQWAKALRLAGEVSDMVQESFIQWDGKPARPIDARIWGLAMERMIAHPPKRMPLTSHGYLKSIAYEIADEADKGREMKENAEAVGAKNFSPLKNAQEIERPDVSAITGWLDERRQKKGGNHA